MTDAHWTALKSAISTLWAVIGPLGGVLLGAYIAGRQQRRERLTESKKIDYQKLVDAITKTMSVYVQFYSTAVRKGEDEKLVFSTLAVFGRVAEALAFDFPGAPSFAAQRVGIFPRFSP